MNISEKKFIVTGGAGFLGTMVVEKLIKKGVKKENIFIPRKRDFDLRREEDIKRMFRYFMPNIIIHLAAHVGGIGYNQKNPGQLFHDNLLMSTHLLGYSRLYKIEKFVGVGTICSYPKFTPVPFKEQDLWSGYPEETNAPYGLAKKMLLVQSQAYRKQYNFNAIHLLPVNLYGPGDNFDPESSHVIPALIKKVREAIKNNDKKVIVWGSGKASREFLYVNDAAQAIILATEKYDKGDPINIGSGVEITIKNLINKITSIMEFNGKVEFDKSKPDGQPRRKLDVSKAEKEFGFRAKTSFDEGLKKTIEWYIKNSAKELD